MIEKYHKKIGFAFLIILIILNGIAYVYLPDTLIMQITFGGQAATTLSKNFALGGMLFLGMFITYYLVFRHKKAELTRWVIAMIFVLAANVFMIIYNL